VEDTRRPARVSTFWAESAPISPEIPKILKSDFSWLNRLTGPSFLPSIPVSPGLNGNISPGLNVIISPGLNVNINLHISEQQKKFRLNPCRFEKVII